MTRSLLRILLASLWVLGCLAPKPHPYELEEGHRGAPGVRTVGLLPLNTLRSLPPELDDATGRVTSIVGEHLEACGVEVVAFGLGETRQLWNRAVDQAGEEEAREAFVRLLLEEHAFDALVEPSLGYREARLYAVTRTVEWDGVKRTLEVEGGAPGFQGTMAGVSLHLAVYARDGTRVFDSFGGLDLAHEMRRVMVEVSQGRTTGSVPMLQLAPRREPLRDEANLREGVALAFSPWLVPPAPAEAP